MISPGKTEPALSGKATGADHKYHFPSTNFMNANRISSGDQKACWTLPRRTSLTEFESKSYWLMVRTSLDPSSRVKKSFLPSCETERPYPDFPGMTRATEPRLNTSCW